MGNAFQESNSARWGGAFSEVTATVRVSQDGGVGQGDGRGNGESWLVSHKGALSKNWNAVSDVQEGGWLSPAQGNGLRRPNMCPAPRRF